MLTTAVSIFAAIALLMPGFIIAELSLAGAARSSRSDLELALRAIAYALVVHLIFGFWTVALVNRVEEAKHLPEHLVALSAYTAVVLLGAPMILGLVLKAFLGRAELRDGPPGRAAASLGAGEARDAFDYAFQRRRHDGAWVIVELIGHSPDAPRLVEGYMAGARRSDRLLLRTTSTYKRFVLSMRTRRASEFLANASSPSAGSI